MDVRWASTCAAALAILAASSAGCGSHRTTTTRERTRNAIALAELRGHIVFSRLDDNIWTANADGSALRRLTTRRGAEFDPSWAPGGKQIAYRVSRGGFNHNDEIYVMNADGSGQRNLTRSPANQWSPSWSPDGRLIAFYSGRLSVMRPDGSHAHPVTKIDGDYPTWSPDGRRLAFASPGPYTPGRSVNEGIFVVGRDGTGLRRLTHGPGEDGWPAWSPDGRSIAFVAARGPGNEERSVWIMRSDGGGKRRVATGEYPVWSPDGRFLMFQVVNHLFVVRPDGSGRRRWPLDGSLPDWGR
jgi:TolB protein